MNTLSRLSDYPNFGVLLCVGFACCMFGCSDDQSQQNGKFGWRYGENNMPGKDVAEDLDLGEDMSDMPVFDMPDQTQKEMTDPNLPMVEVIRYRRQFKDCMRSNCLTEIQFGMRSGMVFRIQSNAVTGRQMLKEEDFTALNTIAQSVDFIDYISNLTCPEPIAQNEDYTVLVTIDVYTHGENQRYVREVTGCYDNDTHETVDDLIDYTESVFKDYYQR